ncbi:DUF998 domain-containing protein [Amycolatopsis sp. K13G38]|uniref:DUF998 domain-containing protein n=1 Tax=Amycolatopsis acididurans TaxID=2724524 RepID=A0ABX1J894_9PSEU|nr:DUF998 domain-containing protein [Amycolatopsis acididurans]NKQ55978.1 DUF998 domain-containing protein [Amycolatopsis acididurans]
MPLANPAPTLPDRRRAVQLAGPLALASYVAFGAAAALLVLLHLIPALGDALDPVTAMLSEYAYTPGRWIWALSLTLTSAGSVALLIALHRNGILRDRIAGFALSAWCVGILAVAVFVKDPQGGAVSLTGKLHLGATAVACATLPVAGLALARRHSGDPRWWRWAVWTRRLALASIPFFLPFIVPFILNTVAGTQVLPTVATGLIERLMAALELVLLTVLATWARGAATAEP